jgi:hypothetical protein
LLIRGAEQSHHYSSQVGEQGVLRRPGDAAGPEHPSAAQGFDPVQGLLDVGDLDVERGVPGAAVERIGGRTRDAPQQGRGGCSASDDPVAAGIRSVVVGDYRLGLPAKRSLVDSRATRTSLPAA